MKRKKLTRTENDQLTSQVEAGAANDDIYDTDLSKFSAEYYERRGRNSIKTHNGDIWIAICLYLILSSVVFVVL